VNAPGVYRLADGSRVEDAIGVAGGVSKRIDLKKAEAALNRAALLSDGAKLYVPVVDEGEGTSMSHNNSFTTYESNRALEQPHELLSGGTGSGQISINTASQQELESLNGIGPVTVKKNHRRQTVHGSYGTGGPEGPVTDALRKTGRSTFAVDQS
jgi:competence protein ComEA